jgi:polysaccharide biosynthesis/export protein
MSAPTKFNFAGIFRFPLYALFAFLLGSGCVQGQVQQSSGSSQESLLLGPGDLIHVQIFNSPELETRARITDDGEVSLPLAGKIQVSSMTPAGAASAIGERYSAGGFLRQPQVTVLVDEYATQSVSIMGEVLRPGNYPVATPRNVMDVLSLAGGLNQVADRHITIQHRQDVSGQGNSRQQVFLPNNPDAALSAQVLVRPGDLIIVPKAGIVYVLGDVGHPGGYVMQDDSTLTVLQAVALAGGATKTAAESHVRLIRRSGTGYTEIAVPLKQIQQGSTADIALQHDDVLWIPFSYGKNFIIQSSSAIMGSAGSAAVYRP